jgi:hypothetical protein
MGTLYRPLGAGVAGSLDVEMTEGYQPQGVMRVLCLPTQNAMPVRPCSVQPRWPEGLEGRRPLQTFFCRSADSRSSAGVIDTS